MEKEFLGEEGLLRLLELLGIEFKKYVKTENGKGLSTNDFTTELKNKLESMTPGGGGENGATFTPSVSSAGVLSWTNDKGLPNPTPVNIKGPSGNDYVLTEADKASITQSVIEGLPVYNGEVVTV